MSFLLRSSRTLLSNATRYTAATSITPRTFSTALRMSVKIDSNVLSQITAGEKLLTKQDGPIQNGPTARAQSHVGQQLTAEIIHEITEAEKAITGSSEPVANGPTAIAQSILSNAGKASNNSIDATPNTTSQKPVSQQGQHDGTLNSATLHDITEAEKKITGQDSAVAGGPTARAQQHANEPITSEALHDITEGEKKITGGDRVKGGPTSTAQSELGKSRN